MFEESGKRQGDQKTHKNFLIEFINTLEWLVTAFMLAFVFRAFVMEAFRIPTGSMADTLKGAHFRLQCPQCGYCFEHGFVPENYGLPAETVPAGKVPLAPYNKASLQVKCPSCGFYLPSAERREVYNGDRILVLKCIYQVFEPQRWDVVVFKNPLKPKESYIKRLIGKPGEAVEIIDGDIYINNRIVRKPPKVQEELWSVIYDNDYQPVDPVAERFNERRWKQPFENTEGSLWQFDKLRPTVYNLDAPTDRENVLRYNLKQGNDLLAAYSYNAVDFPRVFEQCSDLKIRFFANIGSDGYVGAMLGKYDWVYRGTVSSDGEMIISRTSNDGRYEELARKMMETLPPAGPVEFSFANVDHKLVLEFGRQRAEAYLGSDPNAMGKIPRSRHEASVEIVGAGKVSLSHVALFRDIHYLSYGYGNHGCRGCWGNPLTLGNDEFFVLGDNSQNSQDGRWWPSEGIGNSGKNYRAGVVPRDYMVGKAVFVYWPSGFSITDRMPLLAVPDFGHLRFIYGGSDREY